MKSLITVLGLILSLSALANKTGVGVSLGNPTGLNGKYWLDNKSAVDAGLGFSIGKNTDFSIHSDYLLHNFEAFYLNDVYPLDLYYGVGGRMEFSSDIELGLRLPVGLVHKVDHHSADIFGEVAPVLDFISTKGVEVHLLFGARYYF